ncbi:FAD-dependent oxidoreductase, partial [Candidatus Pelagibacter sp.]|nr:FAD-dependent oxidoreductase [Candidatus Pelagibacter sp.]
VSVWESDPKSWKYNAVGYLQISPEVMHEDVASIYEQQKAIGYDSEFIEGEKDCANYMKGMFDDWQATGITSVLHEKKGGYAFNKDSIKALESKSVTNGVNIVKGVKVTGFKRGSNSKAVTGVETDKGIIECEQVVVGAGLGCMTPDNFPIFDRFLENVYMIADANHGYKMIGVGELVAKEILGTESDLLKPFRFNRYEKGELHPTSNSPFPWS